jgi:4-hydroxybenzoate polyprenyltransferase
MRSLYIRICLIAAATFATSAAIIRSIWALTKPMPVVSMVILILFMFAALGIYALILYLTIKPSLKKLTSLPVAISATVVFGGALAGATIHYIRFVPSPEADSPLSIIMASLLLATCVSLYTVLLWGIWKARKSRKD